MSTAGGMCGRWWCARAAHMRRTCSSSRISWTVMSLMMRLVGKKDHSTAFQNRCALTRSANERREVVAVWEWEGP